MNLDTSDGNAFWWGNNLWQNNVLYGTQGSTYAFSGDLKNQAWNSLGGQTHIMILIHDTGTPIGWRSWQRSAGLGTLNPMLSYFTVGNCVANGNAACNQMLGDTPHLSSTASINGAELLVRLSPTLLANYGTFTSPGSPDMQRFGSGTSSGPGDNVGGGLGVWHDANFCFSIPAGGSAFGFACNSQAYRTCSEAQGGWCGAGGTFGTDSCVPMTCSNSNSGNTANWAQTNGLNYDFMILVGRYA